MRKAQELEGYKSKDQGKLPKSCMCIQQAHDMSNFK
jgi:hypothetical protein